MLKYIARLLHLNATSISVMEYMNSILKFHLGVKLFYMSNDMVVEFIFFIYHFSLVYFCEYVCVYG